MGGREGRRENGTQGGEEKGAHVQWEEQKARARSRFYPGQQPRPGTDNTATEEMPVPPVALAGK